MKKINILLSILCTALFITASVLGTLAYLTSQDAVVNTFTIGKVNITLDEAAVHPDGTLKQGSGRVKTNNYHLIPGNTYIKDPTLTVVKGSEESYVRMLLTINCLKELDAAFAPGVADLTTIFNGYDANNWRYEGTVRDQLSNTVTFEFRYKETVKPANDDATLDALFDSITVPGTLDSKDMESISDLKITVVGHAIQATGFDDEDSAWSAFDAQISR